VHRRLSGAATASSRLRAENRRQAKIRKVSACDSAAQATAMLEPVTQCMLIELTMLRRVMWLGGSGVQ